MDRTNVALGLAAVRNLLQPDGADIELVSMLDGTALLRLDLGSAECTTTCVMPRPLLENLALQLMQPVVPGLMAVSIQDPRDP
jgi:hypothetical protein